MKEEDEILQYLVYEVQGTWWTKWIPSKVEWMQELAAWYFNRKANRKFARLKRHREWEQEFKRSNN